MTQWLYLVSLLFAIMCLCLIDRKYTLAFWFDRKRTTVTITFTILLFILWDNVGIQLGIFFDGNSPYMLPARLFPHFPIEELFFLFLLSYTTLLLYTGAKKRWQRI
jgi:lycopene cyclase domain-containing protein